MNDNSWDDRLIELNEVLADYSLGNFNAKAHISDQLDELDSIISGVNMLGEELKETTISRDFFSDIVHAVGDMLFVLNKDGNITEVNLSAKENLNNVQLEGRSINHLVCKMDETEVFSSMQEAHLVSQNKYHTFEGAMDNQKGSTLQVSCVSSAILNRMGEHSGYVMVAKDVTIEKELEKTILKTIVHTQEKEQSRVAVDLHDSLGQELSAIKMMVLNMMGQAPNLSKELENASKACVDLLDHSIHNLRKICFDLMPSALEDGDFINALKELIRGLDKHTGVQFQFNHNVTSFALSKEQKIALYRLAQEFINNSLKHAKANRIMISLTVLEDEVHFDMADNGVGFEMGQSGDGLSRGMRTMKKRIEVFDGLFDMVSAPGQGTELTVTFSHHESA